MNRRLLRPPDGKEEFRSRPVTAPASGPTGENGDRPKARPAGTFDRAATEQPGNGVFGPIHPPQEPAARGVAIQAATCGRTAFVVDGNPCRETAPCGSFRRESHRGWDDRGSRALVEVMIASTGVSRPTPP